MNIIIGLGNPGQKYVNTRHNVGFTVVDELAKINKGAWTLVKPKTFMNQSGKAVKALILNTRHRVSNITVIHDDIDLPVGQFKIQKGRGSAGHKGVQSIINELGTKDFWRIRIGICPQSGKPKNVERFVLQNLTREEKKLINEAINEMKSLLKSDFNKQ